MSKISDKYPNRHFSTLVGLEDKIKDLYLQGKSIRDVATITQRNKSAVGDFIRSLGISRSDFSGVNNFFYGKSHSKEWREEHSKRMTGKIPGNKGKSKYESSKYFNGLMIHIWICGAKERSIEWSIKNEDLDLLWEKQSGKCALTNQCMSTDYYANKFEGVSLDRIDSDIGYTKDNIQFVIGMVNICKNILNNRDFIEMCNKVVTNVKSR